MDSEDKNTVQQHEPSTNLARNQEYEDHNSQTEGMFGY